jgi:RNA polymerase-binding transcription factor DksA
MVQRLTEREVEQFEAALQRARTEGEREAGEIDDILDALERIGEGTYGRCELCREWLPRERLTATPWTRRCTTCESGQSKGIGAGTGAMTDASADASTDMG